jgi:hypothetical protein
MEIIGQRGSWALRVLGRELGMLRGPRLPESINGYLFETHWLWWLALAVIGAALWYRGRTVGAEGTLMARIGTIAVGMALLWAALAMVIDTPAERLYRAHQSMADAAAKGDMDRLVSFLADDFRCPQLDVKDLGSARAELSARLKGFGIRGSTITKYQPVVARDSATVNVALLTETAEGTILTNWRLVWADEPGGDWRIKAAELQKINNQNVPADLVIPTGKGDLLGM